MAKISLGRGIDSLYSASDEPDSRRLSESIPVEKVSPNPFQPRKLFDPDSLSELATSMKRHGLLHPIVVIKKAGEGYTLVSGERRLRAAESLGWTEIPAIIKEFSDQDLLEIALVENLKRSDLNPVEVAEGMHRLSVEFHWTQEHLSEYLGMKRPTIANYLRILDLSAEVLEAVSSERISFGHAKILLSVKSVGDQIYWKNETIGKGLSVRALEERISKKPRHPAPIDPETAQWVTENRELLGNALNCGAKILKLKKGWRVELDFRKMDELEAMITKLSEKFEETSREGS